MGPKIVSSNSTHRDPYPSFYEGNHWDYYFSLLPIFVPLPLFIVPYTYFRRDPILGLKILYSFLGVYQTLESTHFWKGGEKLRRLRKENGGEEERMQKKRRVYRKIKSKSSRRLIERIKVSSDRPLVFVRAQLSWKSVQVQSMCAKMEWMLKWDEKLIWEVFISRRELEAGKFLLGTQQKHQPLDLPHAVERGEQEVVRI